MVMDRHGKLVLAGLHGLELRVPYSGGLVLWGSWPRDKQRQSGFWDLLAWDGCSEWVYRRRTSEDILTGMLMCD